MKVDAIEKSLMDLSEEELVQLISALVVCCNRLPEQLAEEMSLRILLHMVRNVILLKEGGTQNE